MDKIKIHVLRTGEVRVSPPRQRTIPTLSRMSFTLLSVLAVLFLSSCHRNKTEVPQSPSITAEMAYEGVNNYCHREYDWSAAEENSTMMYVTMGDETETEYKVVFRSYTGALVNFYVDKASGTTRVVESVPTLGVDSLVATIDLSDYLEKD